MDNLNLSNDRAARNVWDETAVSLADRLQSLDTGRALVVAGGAAIAAMGLRKRGIMGGLLTATGGLLLYRALTGRDDVTPLRTFAAGQLSDHGWTSPANGVDEAARESFPASDPPSR